MQVIVDGRTISNKEMLHAYLKEQCNFPEYYGNNLDALYDVLTDRPEPLEFVVENADELKEILCGYGEAFIETLQDVAAENERIKVEIRN